jgi:predicted translin family RNA/ssDNA-binding protein
MLNKPYFQKVREELLSYADKRRDVIKTAGDAQQHSKKAIFALQRDDKAEAKRHLDEAKAQLSILTKKYKSETGLFDEGSFKAALEEYGEAYLFNLFHEGKIIDKVKDFNLDGDAFVGALCDVPGELYRYAIKSATEKKFDMVKKCYEAAEEIIGELVDMDLTGYNRNKFDQAKQALHKLEQVVYEVSLRQ